MIFLNLIITAPEIVTAFTEFWRIFDEQKNSDRGHYYEQYGSDSNDHECSHVVKNVCSV